MRDNKKMLIPNIRLYPDDGENVMNIMETPDEIRCFDDKGNCWYQSRLVKKNRDEVYLDVGGTVTGLAGYDYGEKVYRDKIISKVDEVNIKDEDRDLVLFISENIKRVASSFVQGMLKELLDKLGYDRTLRKIVVVSKSIRVINSIYRNVY